MGFMLPKWPDPEPSHARCNIVIVGLLLLVAWLGLGRIVAEMLNPGVTLRGSDLGVMGKHEDGSTFIVIRPDKSREIAELCGAKWATIHGKAKGE